MYYVKLQSRHGQFTNETKTDEKLTIKSDEQ